MREKTVDIAAYQLTKRSKNIYAKCTHMKIIIYYLVDVSCYLLERVY